MKERYKSFEKLNTESDEKTVNNFNFEFLYKPTYVNNSIVGSSNPEAIQTWKSQITNTDSVLVSEGGSIQKDFKNAVILESSTNQDSKFLLKNNNSIETSTGEDKLNFEEKFLKNSHLSKVMEESGNKSKLLDSVMENEKIRLSISKKTYLDIIKWHFKRKKYQEVVKKAESYVQHYPTDLKGLYMLGTAYSMINEHQKTVDTMCRLLLLNKTYKKTVYIILSYSYKKLEQFENARGALNEAATLFPLFYDIYITLGKLEYQIKNYDDAIKAYIRAIGVNSRKFEGFLGLAECYRIKGQYKMGADYYNETIKRNKVKEGSLLVKMVLCLIESKSFDKAFPLVQRCLNLNPENCQALYLKGLLFKIKKETKKAVISYEQAVKLNLSEVATAQSLKDIALIMLERHDVYGCLHTLSRIQKIPDSVKTVKSFKMVVDGAISILKKKFYEGIYLITKGLRDPDIHKTVYWNGLAYKAFALASIGKLKKAVKIYNKIVENQELENINLGMKWNNFMSKGYLNFQKKNFEKSIECFESANSILKNHDLGNVFIWIGHLNQFIYDNHKIFINIKAGKKHSKPVINFKKRLEILVVECLENFEYVLKQDDSNTGLLLAIAILELFRDNESKTERFLERAISRAEEGSPKLYLWKGYASSRMGNHKQAMEDFRYCSHSIKLENAKEWQCQQMSGDLKPDNKISILSHFQLNEGLSILDRAELAKGRLYLKCGELDKAVSVFEPYLVNFSTKAMIKHILGDYMLYHGMIDQALRAYEEAFADRYLRDEVKKQLVFKGIVTSYVAICDLDSLQNTLKLSLIETFDFDVDICNLLIMCLEDFDFKKCSKHADYLLEKWRSGIEEETDDIFESIVWKYSDLEFYQGVFSLYLQDPKTAREWFIKSKKRKFTVNINYLKEAKVIDDLLNQEDEDLISIHLMTYTAIESNLNIALTYIMEENYAKASETLHTYHKHDKGMNELKPLKNLLGKLDPEVNMLSTNNIEKLVFFNEDDYRLCNKFPYLIHNLKGGCKIKFKPSFSMPSTYMPKIEVFNKYEILELLKLDFIGYHPIPPWLKRDENGFVFTKSQGQEIEEIQLNDIVERFDQLDQSVVLTAVKKHFKLKKFIGKKESFEESKFLFLKEF